MALGAAARGLVRRTLAGPLIGYMIGRFPQKAPQVWEVVRAPRRYGTSGGPF